MLRKRSRSKQALMADPSGKQSKATSFPRLFTAFGSFKSFTTENDAVDSPTSTLDPKPFSVAKNPITRKPDPEPIGLAIVIDSLLDEDKPEPGLTRPGSRTIVFGSQLRIQIPGIKTSTNNNSQPSSINRTGHDPARMFTGHHLSASEMLSSEDYTCVTCHGPNPRTIHIFENLIVESQSDVVYFRILDPESENGSGHCSPDHFLSTCCNCKKNLGPREDIFMYRGERAFCSSECRSEEMKLEEPNTK
ncbi:PREDICTED: protein MARD1-like [Tarenaya hassleriana]|uniref:protein MARD1-like n=1 Tax=Tarenaya hassleriana TaxID=28532 RepID=UPI00053C4494|nr:PREDICTED: protein MARD1-like [Tarenaya hassleriana]